MNGNAKYHSEKTKFQSSPSTASPPPHRLTNGYAYMPNPAIYNPHQPDPICRNTRMVLPSTYARLRLCKARQQGVPQQAPQYPNYGPPQQHPHQQQVQQVQQLFAEEQRRASMPPAFPQQDRPPSRPEASPPQAQQQQLPQQQPQQEQEQQQSAPQQMLEPVKRMSVKSRSIFTPIDESRSILSQHWASSTSNAENARGDTATSNNRSQSVDVGAVSRAGGQAKPPSPPQRSNTHNKNRNISMSSMPDGFTPPSRTNSAQLSGGGGKRPVLTVQIPDEPSDAGSNTADSNSSPRSATNAAQRRNGQGNEHNSSVVLPPPSPSASALHSAGASGPPNPFARPHPVSQTSNNSNNNNMIDTPVSALPSRFMTNEFLPSPSSFYPEWNFSGRESNTLPSPLNFATPVVGTGPSFLREDSGEGAGAGDRQGSQGGQSALNKRKTPEPDEGGDLKRAKHEG